MQDSSVNDISHEKIFPSNEIKTESEKKVVHKIHTNTKLDFVILICTFKIHANFYQGQQSFGHH